MRVEDGPEYAVVGCVRHTLDLAQRPGFFGACVAVELGVGNSYSTAVEQSMRMLLHISGSKPDGIDALVENGAIAAEADHDGRRNVALVPLVTQNKAYDFEAFSDDLTGDVSRIGFLLEALTIEEAKESFGILLYQSRRPSTTSLDWYGLNAVVVSQKKKLKELKASFRDEAQQLLDEEYQRLREEFEQVNRRLADENEALRAQVNRRENWIGSGRADGATRRVTPHAGNAQFSNVESLRRRTQYSIEEEGSRINWREILNIAGIVVAISIGVISLAAVMLMLYDIFFGVP
jgi:hypothetical protein